MSIQDALQHIRTAFEQQVQSVRSAAEVEALRVTFLGRKGKVADCFQLMRDAAPEDRPTLGKDLNLLKQDLTTAMDRLQAQYAAGRHTAATLDTSLPGRTPRVGRKHPLTQTLDTLVDIFTRMGFAVAEGPEIETDYYNFEALNIPKDHPARDMQDTFYLPGDRVLRTHTSPMQIRLMEKHQPPFRVIVPGRVFRRDTVDATHSPVFHQVEGLYVDRGVTFGDLKGVLLTFCREMFGSKVNIRVRPSFFQFTEPSVEVDFSCPFCSGDGCKICKWAGWIEIGGAGMVDPAVFGFVNIDPEEYTGFAFGMGVERITMLSHEITDIRLFYDNDLRFLNQF